MEKLAMCRICLVEDVSMYVVVNRNLHELYEKLTDVPFVTEDRRPMLTCFFCCTKLKQCCRFLRKCLEAEQLFAQMLSEDYERDPKIKLEHLEFFNGFSNSPIVHVSIVDGSQTDSVAIKEELPAASESLDDIIDPEEEHQTDKLELDNVDNSYPDVGDTPALHANSDSEDVPLIEVEDDQESIGAPVAKKPKLHTRRSTQGDTIAAEQKKHENNRKLSCVSKIIIKTQNHTSKRTTKFKKPLMKTQYEVNRSINNIALGTSCHNNNKKDYIKFKTSKEVIDSDDIKRYGRACVKEKRFECDICQRSFSERRSLVIHTRTHIGEKPFKCNICQRSFSQKKNVVVHTRTHTGEKPFKCDICQRSFTYKVDLVRHTHTHTGEKPFKCDICQRSFSQKSNLVTHTRTHTGEKPFKCNICRCSFSQKKHLVVHTRTHTGEKPFKCDICQHSFAQKFDLVRHIFTHTGEKHFKCDTCQRSFIKKGDLVRHTFTHTGEKPFKCDICQRSFSQKSILVTHTRTHTGEKPFKCNICQRSFNAKNNLADHIRTHTGEKPFKCEICQRCYTTKSSLIRHTCTRVSS